MESLESANKRGARIIAEYLGGAVTCDAYHMTDPRSDGLGVSSCISKSLQDARVSPEEVTKSSNMLEGTLKTLFANMEAYPDLKANQNYLDLQAQLSDTEDKISYMRQSYNDTVMNYNNAIQTFPGSVFAGMFHFEARVLFDAQEAAQEAPKVQF